MMSKVNPSQNGSGVNGPSIDPSWTTAASELPPPPGYGAAPSPQPQYAQQQYPQARPPQPAAVVPTRMGLAIWALMAPPIGLFALYLASQVSVKQSAGDLTGAIETAHKAKIVSLVGIAIGGLFWSMYLMSACVAAASTPGY